MEEAPSSSDALQPQDLSSACSLPDIECLLKANPIDALRVVPTPAWILGPGTSNGILLPESDSEPTIPAGQIQPDEAFSNTTVTLSYVSRSHLFSEHSPVYGVPSAFLRAYDAGKLAADAGDVDCVQQVSVPLGLTTCEQLGFLTPEQVVENMAALCYLQQPDVENLALETLKSLQANPSECRFPISVDELQNGAANGLWSVNPFQGGFPEENGGDVEGLHPNVNPELVLLISRSEEPLILPNEATSFALSLNPEFVSPLDSALPSEEQTQDDSAQNATPPSGLMNDAVQKEAIEVMNSSSCVKLTKQTENDASDAFKTSDDLVIKTKKIPERKTLPPRAGRGMRLEAIVQNMQLFRCKSTRVVKPRGTNKPSRVKTHNSVLAEKTEVQHVHTEPTEVRRSSRRKATISTSTPVKTFLKCTKNESTNRNCSSLTSNQGNQAAHKHNVSIKKSVKRKNKKCKSTPFFSAQEPEINLKCLKLKKKEVRDDSFAPYVRVQFPNCTIVNYPNEKRGKSKTSAGFLSGITPATPGFQHGRVSMDGEHQDLLVCCLCGSSSNAMDLGDLHGPYYAEGFKPASKVASNHQEDENSDSDSSFRGKTAAEGNWTDSLDWRWSGVGEPARRVRTDSPIDWYSPPVVPLHETEHWFHEDCAIWSAGVFLVRGKLYGLENAVKLAKVSVCSTCQRTGATLGCVYKGCLNKYHYTCAVQSGCVLNEDNYSMKCRKHKNSSYHQINR